MPFTKRLPADLKRLLVVWPRLRVGTLKIIDITNLAQRLGNDRIGITKCFLANLKRLLIELEALGSTLASSDA